MEAHAAVPQLEQPDRIIQELAEVIEQHITQPATQDHPHGAVEDQIAHLVLGPARVRLLGAIHPQQPGGGKADHVHQAVPVHLEGTNGNRHRINLRKFHNAYPKTSLRPMINNTTANTFFSMAEGSRWLSRAASRANGKLVSTIPAVAGKNT